MERRQQRVIELLDTSGARLHALLARLTLSEDVVGDLMQELFMRLSRSDGFDKARDPYAYAYRAAINLAFAWRRNSRRKSHSLDEIRLPAENPGSSIDTMIQAEELQRVLEATSRLSSLARHVVVMRYIEQEPYEEIGRRLGKKPQYVRSLCSKALAHLRSLLADEGGRARTRK
ncbi:MAG: RNA polymerase sigma factor [Phycisphaerales bacterium]|nr:MAG: RNA polymerase sigma factor [Phycisphaerales bacterium]